MKTLAPGVTVASTALAVLVALAVVSAAPSSALQLAADEPIDIDLAEADLRLTLNSMAVLWGAELRADDDVRGTVTIELHGAAPASVLDRICRDAALACELFGDQPPVLRVRRADGASTRHAGYSTAISIALRGANLGTTVRLFAKVGGRELDVDPALDADDRTVTIQFAGTPWPTALDEICRLAGCAVDWGSDPLRVSDAQPRAERLAIDIAGLPVRQAFASLVAAPIFGDLGDVQLAVGQGVHGRVTVSLAGADWAGVSDALCQAAGCAWRLIYGDPSRLEVRTADSSEPADPRFACCADPGAPGVELLARLIPPRPEPPVERQLRFDWAQSKHDLALADRGWTLRLEWLTLGGDFQVGLPMVHRCAGETLSGIDVLPPLTLPLTAPWQAEIDGVAVELRPHAGRPAEPPRSAAPLPCHEPEPAGDVRVTFWYSGEEGPSAALALPTEAGNRLMIRPPEMGGVAPRHIALILLAGDGDRREVALIGVDADGAPKVETVTLTPAVPHAWRQPGSEGYEVRLVLVPSSE